MKNVLQNCYEIHSLDKSRNTQLAGKHKHQFNPVLNHVALAIVLFAEIIFFALITNQFKSIHANGSIRVAIVLIIPYTISIGMPSSAVARIAYN